MTLIPALVGDPEPDTSILSPDSTWAVCGLVLIGTRARSP
jgi:hypothetical protein